MKWVADEYRALESPHLEHSGNCPHRFTGRPACVFHQNRAIGHSVPPSVVPSDIGLTRRVPCSCSTGKYQYRSEVAVPQIEGMIEPRAQHWRGFSRILRRAKYYYRLRRSRLIARAPHYDSRNGYQPDRKDDEDGDG